MFWRRGKARVEHSRSGQPVFRYDARDRPFELAGAGDEARRAALEEHYARYLGTDWVVWHEIVSDLVHVDVYMWRPTPSRPMYTFATVGMSDRPMTLPSEAAEAGVHRFAELLVCLPPDWPVPADDHSIAPWDDPDAYMPMQSLKYLARFPHEYATWLGFGHSIPNGDPPEPLSAESSLCGWVLLPPVTLPPEFHVLDQPGGAISVFGLVALTRDEIERKLAEGTEALFDGFDAHGVSELLDIGRVSVLR